MKLILTPLITLAITGALLAQQGSVEPAVSRLGPHSSGGRGCAACHTRHYDADRIAEAIREPPQEKTSNDALMDSSSGASRTSSSTGWADSHLLQSIPGSQQQEDEVRGVIICLSCHDGNIAKQTMLTGVPYDQRAGLLATGKNSDVVSFLTLLGNDGLADERYFNLDHPVGPSAKFGAAWGPTVAFDVDARSGKPSVSFASGSPEAYFASNYGFPSLLKGKFSYPRSANAQQSDPSRFFLLCTTCHNPHGSAEKQPSYFFLNAPYNPNVKFDPKTQVSSTTQFCRQCHFTASNEYYGQTHIVTVY
jgi:hypothetical protein